MAPVTRYASKRRGEHRLSGGRGGRTGPPLPHGWITQIEQLWEAPANRRFLERLATFGRLILFDSRGTGLSDRVLVEYSVEQEAQDAIAVLDATGSERAAVFTYAVGGLVGAQLAADRPDRIGALVMYASLARTSWAPDYDWAMTSEQREELSELNIATWGRRDSDRMSASPQVAMLSSLSSSRCSLVIAQS